MFVQISPSDKDLSETISSLNFATRVRGIELGPVRKQVDTSELQKLKMMVCRMFSKCSFLFICLQEFLVQHATQPLIVILSPFFFFFFGGSLTKQGRKLNPKMSP